MIINWKSDIRKDDGWKKKLVEHPNLMLVDKNENEQQPSSSRYTRRKSYLTSVKTGTLTRKTLFFALFQKKNLREEVFTDMLSSLASLYKDEDTTDMLVVMRTVEHFFSMHTCLVGFY